MAHKIGINWYSRLQQKIADLEHRLEDTQAYNRELKRKLKNYENNNIRTTRNGKDNNPVKLSGSIYPARNKA
jgi:cell division protein FtsB